MGGARISRARSRPPQRPVTGGLASSSFSNTTLKTSPATRAPINPQKTVLKGPFAPFPRSLMVGERHMSPKPPWFVTNRAAESTTRRLTGHTAAPNPLKLPGIFLDVLRG
jgi:hypothetical protein